MNCQRVQRKISDGDGRELRGRRLSAHLGDCAICRGFQQSIGGRRSDLNMLFPPLGAAAAAKTLAVITGDGSSVAPDASGATDGAAQTATPGRSPRYRRQAAAAGLIAALGAGAAIGLLPPRDDPAGGPGPPPAQARSDPPPPPPPAQAKARDRSRVARADRRPEPGPRSSASPTPSGLAGYNSVDPGALQVLGTVGAAGEQTGPGPGSGPGGRASRAGAGRAGDGGELAFTGLDLGLLLLAGAALLSVGLLTRRWTRPGA